MKNYKALILLVLTLVCSIVLFSCADSSEKFQSFEVEFVSNSGSEIQTAQSSRKTGRIEQPAKPVREGYDFAGWFKDVEFVDEFTFEDIIEKDMTLYAKWNVQIIKCLIKFNGNGSTSGNMDDLEHNVGDVIKLPINKFSRVGYTFAGWTNANEGSIKNQDEGWFYVEKTPITVLYAVWQREQYRVYLDLNGGQSDVQEVTAVFDKMLPSIKEPTKIGYVLVGFFTKPNGEGVMYYGNHMIPNASWKETEDSTLFACWALADNAIYFNGNGSTFGQMSAINTTTFEQVKLTANAFSKTGYSFLNWNTKADGSGTSYNQEEEFFMPAVKEELELFAMWQANRYFLVFDNNIDNQSMRVEAIYDQDKLIIENPFSKRGYAFLNWNMKSDASGTTYLPNENVKNLSSNDNDEITLYAVWQVQTFVINLNKQGGIGGTSAVIATYDEFFPFAIAPTKVGYSFGGYFKFANGVGTQYYNEHMSPMSLSDLVATDQPFAYWIPLANNIVFDGNKATSGTNQSISTFTDQLVDLPQCGYFRTGYTFSGWNIMADGTGEMIESGDTFKVIPSNESVILFAIWLPNKVLITFDGNQSESGAVKSIESFSDKNITLPSNQFVRRGYSFSGWSLTPNGEYIFSSDELFKTPIENQSIVLYAIWNINKYTIHYELYGGVNALNNPNFYTVVSDSIVLSNPLKPGYEFKGWENGNSIPSGSIGDVSFVAKWEIITYHINYILNGGKNNAHNPSTYTVETPTIYMQHPTKDGFQFEGWTEGGVIDKGSTGNRTFTAEWNGVRYAIVYVLNGGENSDNNPTSYTVGSQTIVLGAPTKNGYTFNGWREGSTIPTGSTGDKTFTATWKLIEYTITYVLNGGVNDDTNQMFYTIESYSITLKDPIKIGYAFKGWQEGSVINQGSTGNKTFTAVWAIQTYYIFYSMPSGAINENNPATYDIESETILLLDATMPHYNFISWVSVTSDHENNVVHTPIKSILKGSVGDINLLAIFEPIDFSITYELHGGTNHVDNPLVYNIASKDIILKNPTRDGYAFVGWENGHSGTIPAGSFGDIHFVAIWQEIEYTIQYVLEGGDNEISNPTTYTINSDDIVLIKPNKIDSTFKHWIDASGEIVTVIPKGSHGNLVLTAVWN